MTEDIIALLSCKDTLSLGIDDIAKKIHVKNKKVLKDTLSEMVSSGVLDYSLKKGKYQLFEKSGLFRGNILLDKVGNGIIKINDKDIKIPKRNLNGASFNDLVAVDIDDINNIGVVVRILKRDDANYICDVVSINNKLYIKNNELGTFPANDSNIVEGNIVLVHHSEGKVKLVSILGHKDDPGMDVKKILYKYGFNEEFPDDVTEEVFETIPSSLNKQEVENEIRNSRVDYRDYRTVTIDGIDTKDIDDAFSIRRLDNGNIELKVFIAEGSYFIDILSKIFKEASNRGTSVYALNSVAPMFHHKISNGICSLNPLIDRFAMAYTTTFNSSGKVIDFNVEEAVIRSSKQMTYSDVNKVLSGIILDDYKPYLKDLYLAEKLSILLEKWLIANGFLEFLSDEVYIIMDGNGNVLDIRKCEHGIAEKIIEYFMVITNVELTKYAFNLGLPWIYRVHGAPNMEKIAKVIRCMKLNGYLKGDYSTKRITKVDLQNVLKEIRDMENGIVFSRMLITCQDTARYSDQNIGHDALGQDFYSHNTSDIRRSPDFVNQSILVYFLHNGLEGIYDKFNNLDELAVHYSNQERKAKSCEREVENIKKCKFMSNMVGKEVIGFISYVTNYGFYVLLDNMVEGFVRIDELPQGRYNFDEDRMALISKKHMYNIGSKVLVKVKNVDMENVRIEFTTKDYDFDKLDTIKDGKRRVKKKNN